MIRKIVTVKQMSPSPHFMSLTCTASLHYNILMLQCFNLPLELVHTDDVAELCGGAQDVVGGAQDVVGGAQGRLALSTQAGGKFFVITESFVGAHEVPGGARNRLATKKAVSHLTEYPNAILLI